MKNDSYNGYFFPEAFWNDGDQSIKRKLMVGRFSFEGGTDFEFCVKEFAWPNQTVIRVDVFSDAFAAFSEFRNFFMWLSGRDRNATSLEDVVTWLRQAGYKSTEEVKRVPDQGRVL